MPSALVEFAMAGGQTLLVFQIIFKTIPAKDDLCRRLMTLKLKYDRCFEVIIKMALMLN